MTCHPPNIAQPFAARLPGASPGCSEHWKQLLRGRREGQRWCRKSRSSALIWTDLKRSEWLGMIWKKPWRNPSFSIWFAQKCPISQWPAEGCPANTGCRCSLDRLAPGCGKFHQGARWEAVKSAALYSKTDPAPPANSMTSGLDPWTFCRWDTPQFIVENDGKPLDLGLGFSGWTKCLLSRLWSPDLLRMLPPKQPNLH